MSAKVLTGIFAAGVLGFAATESAAQVYSLPPAPARAGGKIPRFAVPYEVCRKRLSLREDIGRGVSIGRAGGHGFRLGLTIRFGGGAVPDQHRKFLRFYDKCDSGHHGPGRADILPGDRTHEYFPGGR